VTKPTKLGYRAERACATVAIYCWMREKGHDELAAELRDAFGTDRRMWNLACDHLAKFAFEKQSPKRGLAFMRARQGKTGSQIIKDARP